jgi:hypothetical protein
VSGCKGRERFRRDARAPEKFKAETIPGAVNVRQGETKVANKMAGRPMAEAAYWNSSYFGGTCWEPDR